MAFFSLNSHLSFASIYQQVLSYSTLEFSFYPLFLAIFFFFHFLFPVLRPLQVFLAYCQVFWTFVFLLDYLPEPKHYFHLNLAFMDSVFGQLFANHLFETFNLVNFADLDC